MSRPTTPSRRAKLAIVAVEPLEGRKLLSHARPALVQADAGVHVDAAFAPPIIPLGHATNHHPRFYALYTGPKRPELLAISTTGEVVGTNLILTATLGGPLVAKPASPGQEAIYTFGINRGGAAKNGPLPAPAGENLRFDSTVVVAIRQKGGVTGSAQYPDPDNPLSNIVTTVKSSAIVIKGNTLQVTVPISALPSSGRAINQWRGMFFTRVSKPAGPRGVASLVPMFDDYPIGYRPK